MSRSILPQVTFHEGELNLRVGKKTLTLFSLPGHSPDNLSILVEEDRVLFAGDAAMPLPYIVDGERGGYDRFAQADQQDGTGKYRPGTWGYRLAGRDR